MRYVLEHEVGGKGVVGIWDDGLEKGRIVWAGGGAFDLVRPRDDTYIERIMKGGQPQEGGPLPETTPLGDGQLSLFG